jgi:hypothetical protein
MSDSPLLRLDPATGWVDMSAYQHLDVEHELLFNDPVPLHQWLDSPPPATIDEESWGGLIRVVIEDAEPAEPSDEAADVISAFGTMDGIDVSLDDYFVPDGTGIDELPSDLDFSLPDHFGDEDGHHPDPDRL